MIINAPWRSIVDTTNDGQSMKSWHIDENNEKLQICKIQIIFIHFLLYLILLRGANYYFFFFMFDKKK